MAGFITQNETLLTELDAVRQDVEKLTTILSNTGSYVWKIHGVAEKLNDAISEKQRSISSPPFYSSPEGYKMRMRLYFYGDGDARRTHLSVFFVLMKGEYDSILSFPSRKRITFCLFDQTQEKRHIIHSWESAANSSSFQRPRSDENIASGVRDFCPLSTIQQVNNPYVRDDCMFIRALITDLAMPNSLLQRVLYQNPGIPLSISNQLVLREIQTQSNPQNTSH